jgi:hypothetical protein
MKPRPGRRSLERKNSGVRLQETTETALPGCTYAQAKEVAQAEGCTEETVKQWIREGALFHAFKSRGKTGRWNIAVRADGRAFRKDEDPAGPLKQLDPEVVRTVIREVPDMLMKLPPIPDPAIEPLKRGEPTEVVARRVEARGRIVAALIIAAGVVAAVFVAAYAYLRRHGLVPRA